MPKTVSIINQKGGVGKTTTAINLAVALALMEKKVLLVDMDPQGNASSGLGIPSRKRGEQNIYKALVGEKNLDECLVFLKKENLHVLPSSLHLTGAEIELMGMKERENVLKKLLRSSKKEFEYILIDCPPTLGVLTVNALSASNSFLVPLQCEYFALEGLSQLLHTVSLIRKNFNEDLKLEGILLTMFDKRNNLSHQVAQEVKDHFNEKVFNTYVPRNVKLSEAPSHDQSIFEYAPKSPGALSYLKVAEEFDLKNLSGKEEEYAREV